MVCASLLVRIATAERPNVLSRSGNNLAGQYKRAVGMAVQIGVGNFGGAIAANIYRSQDSPRYILGRKSFLLPPCPFVVIDISPYSYYADGVELMFVGIGLIVVPILAFTYKRINNARDEALQQRVERGEKLQLSIRELRDLGDRAPDFRYTL